MTIQKYHLKNLDCANCAAKIEREVQNLSGVRFASVDFATATLALDTDQLGPVQQLIARLQPDIELWRQDIQMDEWTSKEAKHVAKLSIASVFLIASLVFESQVASWVLYLLLGIAFLLTGAEVIQTAYRNIRNNDWFDESFLMSVATVGAIAINEMPEAVGVMLFYQIGEFVQQRSVAKSRQSIQSLLNVRPTRATILVDGEYQEIELENVSVGEILHVRPGEKIPLDGQILKGKAYVDTAALTGESTPRSVGVGDEVLAGMINQTGLLEIEVLRPIDESSISRMLELVQNAANRKSQTQRFITRFAQVYSPIVVVLAALVAIVPPLVVPGEAFSAWVYRALVLLVISCPCALVISIPLGYFGGIGGASRRGILVKGANYLDVLAKIKTLVVDKTGTLTYGVFSVKSVVPVEGWDESELLLLTAQVESNSNHPIARSICRAVGDIEFQSVSDFKEMAGFGVSAVVDGRHIQLGSDALMHQFDIPHPVCNPGLTVVHVSVEGEYAGYIEISDQLRHSTLDALSQIKSLGVNKVVMLTGDVDTTASQVAKDLSVDEVHASLLPEDKVSIVDRLIADKANIPLAFVGDGINDAPALSRADVGIAMGAVGSEAAIEAADVVLMTDSPAKIVEAIQVARLTRTIIWQNIVLALAIKILFITLGIVGLSSMWEAVFADVGVSVLAVLNATRVLK